MSSPRSTPLRSNARASAPAPRWGALPLIWLSLACTELKREREPLPAQDPPPATAARAAVAKHPDEPPVITKQTARRLGLRVPDNHRRLTSQPGLQPHAPAGAARELEAPSGFLGKPEAELLEKLRNGNVVAIRKGTGGRTLAFKLTLDSGIQAYYKPEQSVSSAAWYAEIAAYYLDRALGIGRVPPLVSRKLAWKSFAAASKGDARRGEVTVGDDGQVRGALIYWLPEKLERAATPPGFENWIRSEPFARFAVSPYQRAANYWAALNVAQARAKRGQPGLAYYGTVPTTPRPELPAELSDMIVFDFLTLNYDRFGGNNINLLTLGEGGPLIALDNGDAFSPGPPRRPLLDARLAPLSRFRKRTIDALRAFDLAAFARTLQADPLGPILDANMVADLELRRKAVLEHVAEQERRFGSQVYAW